MNSLGLLRQWFGHGPSNIPVDPPNCDGDALASLLWVDPSLVPGASRARLIDFHFTRATLDIDHLSQWRLARLRRSRMRDALNVEEIAELVQDHADFDDSSVYGRAALRDIMDIDAGDVLGLVGPCSVSVPVAALDSGTTNNREDDRHDFRGAAPYALSTSFAVIIDADIKPGLVIPLSADSDYKPRFAPWISWSFSYDVLRPLEYGFPVQRSGGAFQFLARVSEDAKCVGVQPLILNLRTLTHDCSWSWRYPVYVLHTSQFESVERGELLDWTDQLRQAVHPEVSLRFLDVSDEFSRVMFGDGSVHLGEHDLLWLDLTREKSQHYRKSKPRRFKLGYRHMCRFQSTTVLSLPVFSSVRYLMHIDSDATLNCRADTLDPVQEMEQSSSVYGLFEVGVEDPEFVEGWTGFIREYVYLHEVHPLVPPALLSTRGSLYTKESEDDSDELVNVSTDFFGVTWGTGWEIMDLEFFNSQRVLEFSQKVEKSLGHYRFNWGDHLVRAFQVQLFAPLERVRCFGYDEMPGSHGCPLDERIPGSSYVYPLLYDIACPDFWTDAFVHATDANARECMESCNEYGCAGFDIVFYEDGSALCISRDARAKNESCTGGGAEGAAGDIFRQAFKKPSPVTVVGAANRAQIVERNLNRTFDCAVWRDQLLHRKSDYPDLLAW